MNVNPISFGKVYALYGTNKQILDTYNGICNDLDKNSSIRYIDATQIYQKNNGKGLLTKVAHNGKDVAFVVTGKSDNEKIRFMEFGWTSINGISQHICKAFNVDKIRKKDVQEIKDSARNE